MINNFYKKKNIGNEEKFFDIIIDDGSHKLSDILVSLNIFFKNLRPGGFYIVEEFKHPNFFDHLNDCKEIKFDELLVNLKEKRTFNSNIISQNNINYMLKNIKNIYEYYGLVKYSDIVFIEKLN